MAFIEVLPPNEHGYRFSRKAGTVTEFSIDGEFWFEHPTKTNNPMTLASIAARCRENAEKWKRSIKGIQSSALGELCLRAAKDWRNLEKEIGEELDREKVK